MKQLQTMGYSALLLILFCLTSTNGFLETERRIIRERNTDLRNNDKFYDRNFFGNTWQRLSGTLQEKKEFRQSRLLPEENFRQLDNDRRQEIRDNRIDNVRSSTAGREVDRESRLRNERRDNRVDNLNDRRREITLIKDNERRDARGHRQIRDNSRQDVRSSSEERAFASREVNGESRRRISNQMRDSRVDNFDDRRRETLLVRDRTNSLNTRREIRERRIINNFKQNVREINGESRRSISNERVDNLNDRRRETSLTREDTRQFNNARRVRTSSLNTRREIDNSRRDVSSPTGREIIRESRIRNSNERRDSRIDNLVNRKRENPIFRESDNTRDRISLLNTRREIDNSRQDVFSPTGREINRESRIHNSNERRDSRIDNLVDRKREIPLFRESDDTRRDTTSSLNTRREIDNSRRDVPPPTDREINRESRIRNSNERRDVRIDNFVDRESDNTRRDRTTLLNTRREIQVIDNSRRDARLSTEKERLFAKQEINGESRRRISIERRDNRVDNLDDRRRETLLIRKDTTSDNANTRREIQERRQIVNSRRNVRSFSETDREISRESRIRNSNERRDISFIRKDNARRVTERRDIRTITKNQESRRRENQLVDTRQEIRSVSPVQNRRNSVTQEIKSRFTNDLHRDNEKMSRFVDNRQEYRSRDDRLSRQVHNDRKEEIRQHRKLDFNDERESRLGRFSRRENRSRQTTRQEIRSSRLESDNNNSRQPDNTERISLNSKDENNNYSHRVVTERQSKPSERRMATSFNTDVTYIPATKSKMFLTALQIVLLTFLVVQGITNSSKTKTNWLQNFVTVTKKKVL